MSDALINWFVANLGGKVGKELILFIISMVPILELRGGLLAAGPAFLNIPMWRAIPVGIIGNLLPIPFILLLITKILEEYLVKLRAGKGGTNNADGTE